MDALEIEALERSVVAGVAPREAVEIGGWLVPLDDGWIGRAKSAVPIRHDLGPEAIGEVEAAFRDRGLPPAFRVADVPGLKPVQDALAARGFTAQDPTMMKLGTVAGLAGASEAQAEVLAAPDDGWAACFVGPGFDPVEGASRAASLARSPGALYGAVRDGEGTWAVGAVSSAHGWAGLHGMRTAADRRRQGLASQVMAGLGAALAARGADRCALQVLEANTAARTLYRRAGFAAAWRYHYWRRPQ